MRIFAIILFLCSGSIKAQNITIYFSDSLNNDAVAFASVINSNNKYLATADVDGKVSLPAELIGSTLIVKSVGYKNTSFIVSADKQRVLMPPDSKELDEVQIFPGENPAHRLIRNAINNRDENNPEKCCRFTYESYNKLVFFVLTDSLEFKKQKTKDTSDRKMFDFIEKSNFFLTESVTEKKHIPPDQDHEKVIAARVSGFSNPMFAVLSTELQSFSFYNDYVSLAGERYLSPLCPGSINKYLFLISDTLIEGNDSTYIITFVPRENKSFKAMRGEIHISTRGFAIAGVKAEPAGTAEATFIIKIQQLHTQIDGETWFPVQLNARLSFPKMKLNDFELIGEATGYIRNIKLNAHVRNRDIQEVDLEMPDKNTEHEKLLQEYRADSLTAKDKYTYRFMDSLSKTINLEKKLSLFTSLLSGRIPIGPLDLDLTRLIDFNNYEGYRLGLGLLTSRRLCEWAHVGGYGAYGFKDKDFKYGAEVGFHLWPKKDVHLEGAWSVDLTEAASPMLFTQQAGALSDVGIRELYLSRFDMTETFEARLRFRCFKHFAIQTFARTAYHQPKYDYNYISVVSNDITIAHEDFMVFETGVRWRFKFREKFFLANGNLISKGSKWPTFIVEYVRSWKSVMQGEWNMERIKFMAEQAFNIRHLGRLILHVSYTETGSLSPYFYLIHPAATYAKIGVSSSNTFETMRPYEFAVNRGVAIHVTHKFLSALFNRKQKPGPQLELCGNAFYGELTAPAYLHSMVDLRAPTQWYTEAGFRIQRLLKSNISTTGVGLFYRFGPNAFNDWKQDIAFRITFGFSAE